MTKFDCSQKCRLKLNQSWSTLIFFELIRTSNSAPFQSTKMSNRKELQIIKSTNCFFSQHFIVVRKFQHLKNYNKRSSLPRTLYLIHFLDSTNSRPFVKSWTWYYREIIFIIIIIIMLLSFKNVFFRFLKIKLVWNSFMVQFLNLEKNNATVQSKLSYAHLKKVRQIKFYFET